MIYIYNIAIFFYVSAIRIAAKFSPKAKLWVAGRRGLFQEIKKFREDNLGQLIWFHCASLGEFEQGRPVIELWKQRFPDWKIVISFYSPSGYEIRKNYDQVDAVFYLPADTKSNARKFINTLQPDIAIFVKYEFWYHHLNELSNLNIPTYLISAIFKENQIFFKWYGQLHQKMLSFFNYIFVQNKKSAQLLHSTNCHEHSTVGDTRTDRVADIVAKKKNIQVAADFSAHHEILVCGSTWEADEDLLAKTSIKNVLQNWKIIIAPHEINESHLNQIENKFPNSIRYSEANKENIRSAQVLIIDNIGMLSSLYAYGDIAYIGGGFGVGIHNTLEPAAHGLPIIFGSKYQKFSEAIALIQKEAAFSISNEEDLEQVLIKLQDSKYRAGAGKKAADYISTNLGATEKIVSYLSKRNTK